VRPERHIRSAGTCEEPRRNSTVPTELAPVAAVVNPGDESLVYCRLSLRDRRRCHGSPVSICFHQVTVSFPVSCGTPHANQSGDRKYREPSGGQNYADQPCTWEHPLWPGGQSPGHVNRSYKGRDDHGAEDQPRNSSLNVDRRSTTNPVENHRHGGQRIAAASNDSHPPIEAYDGMHLIPNVLFIALGHWRTVSER